MCRVLYGLSQCKSDQTTKHLAKNFRLCGSTTGRIFKTKIEKTMKHFMSRRFDDPEFVLLFIDGRTLRKANSLCGGPDHRGREDHFRIRRSQNESTECIPALLQGPQERGFRPARKLPLPDRSKGLRKEVHEVFGDEVLIQRCRQQKRENVIPGSGIWTLPQMSGKIWSRRRIGKKENCRH